MNHKRCRYSCFVLVALCSGLRADDLGLRVAPGFEVTLYADSNLANDIYAMTLDSAGRAVVTGPGYIKILHDSKGVGKADRSTVFASPAKGGMGMCFDGNDLYFCGGGWLSRFRDTNGSGHADGPPEHLWPLAYAEHGGHAMRKGPDGWWYVIGGNDSGIDRRHITLPNSPVQNPEAGAVLRLTPDCRQSEIFAHGFRNPYDFDFNSVGDLFTYDSDVERVYFLPWYTPTRIYHIEPGGHHGWRLNGYLRSWCRRDFYTDTVDVLWPVGRGSPTGVACYRHDQFPEHYRHGVFVLDWTFGKIFFFPLERAGSSYRTQPEVFLEAVGTSGFDPTDIVVTPDGSLLVSMGGRGTRGSVFRIRYSGARPGTPPPATDLDRVLEAHQPLDAWSRAIWQPLARKLGAASFSAAATDEHRSPLARVRAIEIMTEMFGGLTAATAGGAAKATDPLVRARVAWSIGRAPFPDAASLLVQLADDEDPAVRCRALESLTDRVDAAGLLTPPDRLLTNLGHPDKRVRQASARFAAHLSDTAWQSLLRQHADSTQTRLSLALAALWRGHAEREQVINTALQSLREKVSDDLHLQALRLIVMALGDFCLHDPPLESFTAYAPQQPLAGPEGAASRIGATVRPLIPATDARINEEVARLLAFVEDADPASRDKIASFWTASSSPTDDVHCLIVFARLKSKVTPALSRRVAQTLVGLHGKLEGREQRIKQVWGERLAEITAALIRHDPLLPDELLRQPGIFVAGNEVLALSLPQPARARAASLFLEFLRKTPDFPWSEPLLELLADLPVGEAFPLFRSQWANLAMRDAVIERLAKTPQAADRQRFLASLDSPRSDIVHTCLTALLVLPPDTSPQDIVPLLRLLRRLEQEPRERKLRSLLLKLIERQSGRRFPITEVGDLKAAYEPVFRWFRETQPTLATSLEHGQADTRGFWDQTWKAIPWQEGIAGRGETIFRALACETCHAGSRPLGPDLKGITARLSREDLFTAIVDPSRDVAPAYRTTAIETKKGIIYEGIVAFESADGVILQTGAATTVRIATPDIVERRPGTRSLMPDGLLKDLKPRDLADLYAYLREQGSAGKSEIGR
jgi:putative membrane-bound dehydrogenase-like protein